MPLAPGARVGSYDIQSILGAGGMGEVYRARDTRLKREVALKVLPQSFATDPDRLARFQREAEVLALLNHSNIAAIHGLEESNGIRALVMEFVDGETLADRIRRGPIPIDEALPIATQIAEALEAAHEQGIVHRDLKPANVKLRLDGTVKVLDFGLAKALEPASAAGGAQATTAPTITSPAMTGAGVLLGTAAYMSPEQARGKAADKRADVWAFGCVLYEMLTGRRAFDGDDVAETLAAVIRGEPSWTALPQAVPPLITALLRRCLQKDRRQRVGDIAAALFALQEVSALEAGEAPKDIRRRRPPKIAAIVIIAAVAAGITSAAWWTTRPLIRIPAVARLAITLPADQQLQQTITPVVAISPDGTNIAYMANQSIYVRPLSATNATPIPIPKTGVLIGLSPTFSPDGQSIAFYSDRKLVRVALTGGPTVPLCDSDVPSGISWGADGIVFGQGSRGILHVSADGGTPKVLARVQPTELAASPQMLPGGDSLLFTLATAGAGQDAWDRARIVVQNVTTGERTTVVEGASEGHYVPTGHLVFAVGGVLFAQPFDLNRLQVSGARVPIVSGVRRGSGTGSTSTTLNALQLALSESGSLVYVPGPPVSSSRQTLVLSDSQGNITPLKLPPGPYQFPRVSPDGRQVAFGTDDGKEANVWIYDLDGSTQPRRLTFGGQNRFPVWSGDGQWVAFQSDREGDLAIFRQRADGSTGTAERLTVAEDGTSHVPESWSPQGHTLLFTVTKGTEVSLQALALPSRKATPFPGVSSNRWPNASFSPDGRWVAYSARTSTEASETLYVQPFPPSAGLLYQISTGDAHFPVWSRDGRLIFIDALRTDRGRVGFVGVTVSTRSGFAWSDPMFIPRGFNVTAGGLGRSRTYDITPDGQFIGVTGEQVLEEGQPAAPQIQVILNWFEELKRLVPVN
jgi:serine/threonine-protein kinase